MNAIPPTGPPLPSLGDDRVDAMERGVFARITAERRTRRIRRARIWTGAGAAAALVVVAAVISPFVLSQIAAGDASSTSTESAGEGFAILPGSGVAPSSEGASEEGAGAAAPDSAVTAPGSESAAGPEQGREFTSSGSATLLVDAVADAAREIEADAEARGGYVESVNVDSSSSEAPASGLSSDSGTELYPYPTPEGAGWITVRVPAAELRDALDALDRVGEVTSSHIGRQDVTDQAVDLRARVAASEASVARLTELIAQAESVGDLIAAESALAERQAVLDSDRQQLEGLENQVAMSTLSVQLTPRTAPVEADPASFVDGLAAGWNGLIATLNGIVIAIGFLLPWIIVLGIIAAVVWGFMSIVKRSRSRRVASRPGDDTE